MATDDWGDPIKTSEFIRDENGNLIPNPAGGGKIIYTGLGNTMLDQWGEAFDPGGIRYGDDPLITSGSAIRDYLGDVEDDYWKSFDQDWYGMDDWDYGFYGGRPETEDILLGGPWSADPLPTEMASMGEMQPIYGEELDPGREASWLYLTGTPQFRDRTIYS